MGLRVWGEPLATPQKKSAALVTLAALCLANDLICILRVRLSWHRIWT